MTLRLVLLSVVGALLSALALAPTSAQAGPDADPAPVELALDVPSGYEGQDRTAILIATRDGAPVPGLTVIFTRTSGETNETVTSTDVTDPTGTATTDFVLDGPVQIDAVVTNDAGAVVGTAGPAWAFPDVVCRCSPPGLNGRLQGRDARNGDDRLAAAAARAGADAVVRLFRVRQGVATRVRSVVLGEDGVVKWRIGDRNGSRATRYYASFGKTVVSLGDRTKIVAVR
ncbi:hypothetical protein AB0N29_01590 [Nocardioides sp. NPDC092400]|uniref:hypothetical protein n=1 Tax=Nocardioides sp. NPDC092400 TaxID=3155196 RepID=UPI00344758F8